LFNLVLYLGMGVRSEAELTANVFDLGARGVVLRLKLVESAPLPTPPVEVLSGLAAAAASVQRIVPVPVVGLLLDQAAERFPVPEGLPEGLRRRRRGVVALLQEGAHKKRPKTWEGI
jgi:hypothetical protein